MIVWDKYLRGPLMAEEAGGEETAGGGGAEGSEEETTETSETSGEEETEETSEETEEQVDEKEAKALYALLKDPKQRILAIQSLANMAGLNIGTGEPITKKEEAAQKRDIKAILKDSLGEYYPMIGEKLGVALEQMFDQERSELTSTTKGLEARQTQADVDRELSKLAGETRNESRKFEKRMEALAAKFHPAEGVSIGEYVRTLYTIASSEKASTSTAKKISERIAANSRNAADRIGSATGAGARSAGVKPATGLKNIVEQTYQRLQKTGK